MKKNDVITLTITDIGMEGEGIARFDGTTVFVPFCLVGEEVEVKILKVKGSVAFAKKLNILKASEKRVQPRCKAFERCGGCSLQHLDYSCHAEVKKGWIKNCFKKIALLDVDVDYFEESEPYGYRNKLQLPVRASTTGEPLIGFFKSNSHIVTPIDECPIQRDGAEKIIRFFKSFIEKNGVACYDELSGKGSLRHVVVRSRGGEYLFAVVTTSDKISWEKRLIGGLIEEFGENISIVRNINDKNNNVILGDKSVTLYGKGFINVEDEGINYEVGVYSFMQVNDRVKTKIYEDVVCLGGVDESSVVIDAYSGTGVMTAMLAKRAKKAYGIELVEEASRAARQLNKRNGVENVTTVCAACEDALPEIIESAEKEGDKLLLVLDPPRKGADKRVIETILKKPPQRIAYVSCSPKTLARDAGLLVGSLKYTENGIENGDARDGTYEIETIGAYDMFAQTANIETLVCLSKKSEKHISVDVEFGEDEGQISLKKIQEKLNEKKPKKKTTYKDIQAYIEEKYGFKVHTAYIAEVKRNLGLPMYDAPNAVEELKKPRQHPTERMVEAIKDALKHFEII